MATRKRKVKMLARERVYCLFMLNDYSLQFQSVDSIFMMVKKP